MSDLKHRKSDARLHLINQDGTPVANSTVKVNQTSQKFLFGCGAFDAVYMNHIPDETIRTKLQERMNKWLELFNYGTLPFYWGQYEREEGKPSFEITMEAAKWLQSKGVTVKGHPLCWHTACADWLLKYSNEEILQKQLARIERDVTGYKGVIDMWDVINEVVIMPNFDKYDNAITRICKDKGRIQLVKEVFAAAKASNPNATLLINDFNVSAAYECLIDGLLNAGVPISVIGIQSHQHQGYWGAEKLNDVLERFSRFGLPIHFTENTLISGDIMPAHIVDLNDWQVESWPSTPEGEERQAKEMSEMYTILFNHPLVEAITTWDFNDGKWLKAPSGFVYEDNTEKPSFHAMKKLIHETWETHETLTTDAEGNISFNGFKGNYEIEVNGKKATFTLDDAVDAKLTLS